jgi:ferredoxin
MYYVTDECTGCGLCAENCPAGNISMEGDKPVFGKDCCLCLRCVYACPAGAIKAKLFKSAIIKEGFDIEEIEKKPVDETQPLPKSLAWKGLRLYLEELEREQDCL